MNTKPLKEVLHKYKPYETTLKLAKLAIDALDNNPTIILTEIKVGIHLELYYDLDTIFFINYPTLIPNQITK